MVFDATVPTLAALKSAIISNPLVVSPDTSVMEAIVQMGEVQSPGTLHSDPTGTAVQQENPPPRLLRSSCVVVVDNGQVVGILTEGDVVRLVARHWVSPDPGASQVNSLVVGQVMTRPVAILRDSALADLGRVLPLLQQHPGCYVPVLDDRDCLVGVVTPESLCQVVVCTQAHLQTEQDLSVSEERLRLALKASNQGLYDLDLQTGKAIVNPEYALMLGYDPTTFEETNSQWIERLHPDDREPVAITYRAYVAGEIPDYRMEFRQRTLNGDYKWILSLGKIVAWDEDGQPLRMLGTHTDITELKRVEEQSRHRLDILEAARDIIASADSTGQITYLNQAGRTLLGIAPDTDVSQTQISDYHPPQIARLILQEAMPQCAHHGFWAGETVFRRQDGSDFPVWQAIVAHYRQDGSISHFSTIARDIRDLKQAEQERLEAEHARRELRLLENILDTLLAGYWDMDLVNDSHYISPGFKRMFGYEDHELPNAPDTWQRLIFPEDLPKALESYANHLQSHGKIPYCNELRYRHKNGSTIWVICTGQVIDWDGAGNARRMIGCHIDITERKQAEAQLQETKEELERFFTLALDLLCIANTDGRFLRLNRAWEVVLGYSLHELEGQPFLEFVHPDDIDATLMAVSALDRQELVASFVNRYRCRDGSYRYIEWFSRPYGNLIYAAARDITDRMQAELKMRRSDAHLKTAQRIGKLGSWEFDVETGEIWWSDEVFRIFGLDPEAGPPSFDALQQLFHPDDRAHHQQAVQRAIDTLQPYEIELRAYRPDGTLVYTHARGKPVLNASEQPIQLVGTVLDITDRKQAEDQLQSLSDRLMLAVKSGAIGIWDWDVSNNILTWDDRMYELYGTTPREFNSVYDAWASRLHPDDRPLAEGAIQQALTGEKEYDPEFRVIHLNGDIRYIKAYALVQRGPQGEPQRMIGINYDITDRKQAEEQIRQYAAQLEVSNRELEAFAYSVSHDLRAPLRAIDGFSKALLEDYGDTFDEDGKDYFDRIRKNVTRMGMLIDDLLSLSRVSRTEIRYTTVNLSTLAQEVVSDLQASDPQRSVDWVIVPEAIVSADATLMRVVLTNLLQNAWKFTSHHPTARIEFGLIAQAEQPTYFVRDDGAGFDMAFSKMLFGVFQRLHNTNEFPGTGIGLATVQRSIHRHGGRIWAEGAVEQGATFYFTIPPIPLKLGA